MIDNQLQNTLVNNLRPSGPLQRDKVRFSAHQELDTQRLNLINRQSTSRIDNNPLPPLGITNNKISSTFKREKKKNLLYII